MPSERKKPRFVELDEDLIEIIIELHVFFNDYEKVKLWMITPNPHLGGIRPISMCQMGRSKRLLQTIRDLMEGNLP